MTSDKALLAYKYVKRLHWILPWGVGILFPAGAILGGIIAPHGEMQWFGVFFGCLFPGMVIFGLLAQGASSLVKHMHDLAFPKEHRAAARALEQAQADKQKAIEAIKNADERAAQQIAILERVR